MSYRPDLQQDFDKLVEAPFGTQAVKYVSSETEARTIQSWYRGQLTKYNSNLLKMASQGFEIDPMAIIVTRKVEGEMYRVVATKLKPPSKTEFIYPKED